MFTFRRKDKINLVVSFLWFASQRCNPYNLVNMIKIKLKKIKPNK